MSVPTWRSGSSELCAANGCAIIASAAVTPASQILRCRAMESTHMTEYLSDQNPCRMNDGRSGGKNRESCGGGGPAGQSTGDGFAYLLRGQPAALADELPLHLSNERHRPWLRGLGQAEFPLKQAPRAPFRRAARDRPDPPRACR